MKKKIWISFNRIEKIKREDVGKKRSVEMKKIMSMF